jgi:hypothetical protein
MMTPDKPIRDIVAILGREVPVDLIEEAVAMARQPKPNPLWPPHPVNKSDKIVAQSIGRAFAKLEKRLTDKRYAHEAPVVYRATYGHSNEFSEFKVQLQEWRECFEGFAGKAAPESGLFDIKTFSLGHRKKATPKMVRERRAVEAAAWLLESLGVPLTVTRKSQSKQPSAWRLFSLATHTPISLPNAASIKRGSGLPNNPTSAS